MSAWKLPNHKFYTSVISQLHGNCPVSKNSEYFWRPSDFIDRFLTHSRKIIGPTGQSYNSFVDSSNCIVISTFQVVLDTEIPIKIISTQKKSLYLRSSVNPFHHKHEIPYKIHVINFLPTQLVSLSTIATPLTSVLSHSLPHIFTLPYLYNFLNHLAYQGRTT